MSDLISIEDRVFDRAESVGEENLTPTERIYWLIWLLEAEANNGGLEQFLFSCSDVVIEVITALREIGARKMAELLQEAINYFENKPKPYDSETLSEENQDKLCRTSSDFTDYPDNLGVLLDQFIKEHESDLLGPKTELELWESRKSRGTHIPKFVTKEIDYEKEALEDKKYSSRCCPECNQPVPDYRKNCKKCGYPVGRIKMA